MQPPSTHLWSGGRGDVSQVARKIHDRQGFDLDLPNLQTVAEPDQAASLPCNLGQWLELFYLFLHPYSVTAAPTSQSCARDEMSYNAWKVAAHGQSLAGVSCFQEYNHDLGQQRKDKMLWVKAWS